MRLPSRAILALAPALALAGCGDPAKPLPPPVAVATIEIVTQQSSRPDTTYDATCQLTANVVLRADRSSDPAGRGLAYEWEDRVAGQRTIDFRPLTNPVRLAEPEFSTGLFTLGGHEITLTVIATDGRKARATLRVLVTSCEDCGP